MSSHSLTQFAVVSKYTPNPSSGETTCPSSPGENFNFSSKFMSLGAHLDLLKRANGHNDTNSAALNAPIFTQQALEVASGLSRSGDGPIDDPFSQYGLLAGDMEAYEHDGSDPRIFYNIAVPSSVFICGSQGSGKSHSLSCILENALLPSVANVLPDPLTGIVFHYDAFISDTGGSPCEAAFISSSENVSVRVLCAPTSIAQIRRIYSPLPNVVVEELRINESDLNTRRMLDLMAVNPNGEGLPLYLHVIMRILRDLRIHQQNTGATFNYGEFKRMVDAEALKEGQLAPLQQRLATLESFMNQRHASSYKLSDIKVNKAIPSKKSKAAGNIWKPKAGQLTIVDLSCPCVTAEMACSLFGICLSLFLEQKSDIGRIIALDEAHKYMTDSAECKSLTESLLATIRLQRHLGARVVISTQEPTISPRLLDLCSTTLVHRFTSPDWLEALKKHLAGASSWSGQVRKMRAANNTTASIDDLDADERDTSRIAGVQPLQLDETRIGSELFHQIVHLHPGEALLFSPSAVIGASRRGSSGSGGVARSESGSLSGVSEYEMEQLGRGVLKVCIRQRVTKDGGRSVMASAKQ